MYRPRIYSPLVSMYLVFYCESVCRQNFSCVSNLLIDKLNNTGGNGTQIMYFRETIPTIDTFDFYFACLHL